MRITEPYQFAARIAGEQFSCAQYYTGANPRLNGVHKEYLGINLSHKRRDQWITIFLTSIRKRISVFRGEGCSKKLG
jgi:hypothetical protein